MKRQVGLALVCAALMVAGSVAGRGVDNLEVTVSDAAGRLSYRGRTDSNGVFASRPLAAGEYVVQFKGRNVAVDRNDYAIFAAAGHRRVVADSIAGAKFAGGGVAMRLKSTARTPVIGQVAIGGVEALGTKIVKGVRFILVPPVTGELGPRWVEEGTQAARNVTRIRVDDPGMIKPPTPGTVH